MGYFSSNLYLVEQNNLQLVLNFLKKCFNYLAVGCRHSGGGPVSGLEPCPQWCSGECLSLTAEAKVGENTMCGMFDKTLCDLGHCKTCWHWFQ